VVLFNAPQGKEANMDWAFRRAVNEARRHGGLYFASLLPEDRILQAFGAARWFWQGWIYSPAVTIWVFLSQCLSSDHSCREAVARLIAWRLAGGLNPCSAETGAYCTAREGLSEEACVELMRHTGGHVDDHAPAEWLWCGRRVRSVDGSTITMPDTDDNQREYPQQPNQKPGCGFPIARIVVVFSLAVGTALDAAIGKYEGKQTGENSLFRTLHNTLREGDVVLGDRCFSGWFDIALLQERGVDIVVRKHQLRITDFRRGQRLGREDHLVCWSKPQRPDWMSKEQHAALPESLTMREVRIHVKQAGFRTRELVVVTTLRDHETYVADEIAQLYRRRWQAELNLRSLKVVLQMDHLRCKTPHRARNEFYMHLAAYNLIRQLMAIAASHSGVEPWTMSFKGTMQTINQLLPLLCTSISTDRWCEALWEAIATHNVGNRPDRFEPRVKKRRPKEYDLMVRPRRDYKRLAA
jgi:putative transposase